MIAIRQLTRCYGTTVAVNDVSLDIGKGEVIGLLGHNGAGKTTMMKVLTGFLEPTNGTVSVDGLDVVADRTAVQHRLGYLPEHAPVYSEMLVQDYLLTMGELRSIPRGQLEDRVVEAAARTGLIPRLTWPIHKLSKGYRQRVGLAQAILHRPDVLVLDEPTNGLDPMQIEAIRELIRELARDATIILSTHILQEVEAVCDRVLVLIDGDLVADASLEELTSSNRIRLALTSDPGDVEAKLAPIEGVADVAAAGETTAGHPLFLIHPDDGADPTQAILRAAIDAGWSVLEVARDTQRLEDVFKQLQHEHILRARGENG